MNRRTLFLGAAAMLAAPSAALAVPAPEPGAIELQLLRHVERLRADMERCIQALEPENRELGRVVFEREW